MTKRSAVTVVVFAAGCGGAANAPATPSADRMSAPPVEAASRPPPASTTEPALPRIDAPPASKWTRYTSTTAGFEVSLPCAAPTEDVAQGGNEHLKFTSHILHCAGRKTTEPLYSVEHWTDVSVSAAMRNAAPPEGLDAGLAELLKDQFAQRLQGKGMETTSHPITAGGMTGFEIVAQKRGARIIQRTVIKLPRSFTLSIINAEMGDEAENAAFVASFAIREP